MHHKWQKNRWSKGLWEVWEEIHKVNKTRTSFFYSMENYIADYPLSILRRQPIKGPQAFVWKTDIADREKERGRGRGKSWLMGYVPPHTHTLSRSMYLWAAKPCLILMSSAFCNLTWEFKSCLSFASLMSAGSYISRTAKRRDWLVELHFLADVRCTSLPTINWDESASCRRKKGVIWQHSRYFTAIFIV